MSRRSWVLAAVSIVLAFASALGADGGIPDAHPQRVLAAPLDAPLAAPDNSIVLQPFLSGFSFPVFMTHAGDGTNRLWVVEKSGLVKLVVNGQVRPTPFMDLIDEVADAGEQGLLGLAFHPQYETNRRFFVYYTAAGSPTGVGNNTEIANPVPVRTLISIPDRFSNHNGSTIAFGPDGYLYVSMGDEGSGGDPDDNAQNPLSLYGKMLRLDVDNGGNPTFPPNYTYSIPPSNPFVGNPGFRPEIWALGFRNPYRWSFDRQTGDIFVGDVGQGAWEEIDFLPSGVGGQNFGWDDREGAHCFEPLSGCRTAGLTDPILEYNHGLGCAITGGYRHRKASETALYGQYFYGDFCSGRVWRAVQTDCASTWATVEALDTSHQITSFAEDESGDLYVVASSGQILRIAPTQQPPPAPAVRPRVIVQSTRIGAGTLQVNVGVTTNATTPVNSLQSIAFTRIDNARVSIGSQVNQETPFTFTAPGGSQGVGFTVSRKQAGLPMTVHLTATDICGPWRSFVGGGVNMP
jgi:glucose/arabinose dehydrogenase